MYDMEAYNGEFLGEEIDELLSTVQQRARAWDGKQDKVTGQMGQVAGFTANGDLVPQSLSGFQGPPGESAGFGSITAQVVENGGAPSVSAELTGPDTAKNIRFTFNNMRGPKGETGAQGEPGPQGPTGPPGTIASGVSFTPPSGMDSTNVQDAVEELFQSVSDGKRLVASAITDKGVPTAQDAAFQTMANNIRTIQTGTDTSDATASASDILSPKTAYVDGRKITGTIQTKNAANVNTRDGVITVAAGFYDSPVTVNAYKSSSWDYEKDDISGSTLRIVAGTGILRMTLLNGRLKVSSLFSRGVGYIALYVNGITWAGMLLKITNLSDPKISGYFSAPSLGTFRLTSYFSGNDIILDTVGFTGSIAESLDSVEIMYLEY